MNNYKYKMIKSYNIWKVKSPNNRMIGDNMCHFDGYHVCVIQLIDNAGHEAWGYAEKVADGYFKVPVSWESKLPSLSEMKAEFETEYWELLKNASSVEELQQSNKLQGDYYLKNAIRFALWDLKGLQTGLPLYKLINPNATTNKLKAYISGLEFPQNDEWVKDFYTQRKKEGFKYAKAKIGHPDPDWDVKRLQLIKDTLGEGVELAADANIAWDAKTTIERINYYIKNGINLSYIEDPIKPNDYNGYRLLAKELPIKIVGHDYIPNPADLRPLLDTGALAYLRIRDGVDYGIEAQPLALEYGIPMILTNTYMEVGIHFGAGNPNVDRIEYADIGWSGLTVNPFKVEGGFMYAHEEPGTGLKPNVDLLEEWAV